MWQSIHMLPVLVLQDTLFGICVCECVDVCVRVCSHTEHTLVGGGALSWSTISGWW